MFANIAELETLKVKRPIVQLLVSLKLGILKVIRHRPVSLK